MLEKNHSDQQRAYDVKSIEEASTFNFDRLKNITFPAMIGRAFLSDDQMVRGKPITKSQKLRICALKFFDENTLLLGTKVEDQPAHEKVHPFLSYSLSEKEPTKLWNSFYSINYFLTPWWDPKKCIAVMSDTLSFCTFEQKKTLICYSYDYKTADEFSTVACHPTEKALVFAYKDTPWIDIFNVVTRLITKKILSDSGPTPPFLFCWQ